MGKCIILEENVKIYTQSPTPPPQKRKKKKTQPTKNKQTACCKNVWITVVYEHCTFFPSVIIRLLVQTYTDFTKQYCIINSDLFMD